LCGILAPPMAIPTDLLRVGGEGVRSARIHEKPEALRGVGVLDLSVIYFGPATADFLGELGAEVIRTLQRTTLENQIALRAEIEKWSVHHTTDELLARVLADPAASSSSVP